MVLQTEYCYSNNIYIDEMCASFAILTSLKKATTGSYSFKVFSKHFEFVCLILEILRIYEIHKFYYCPY